MSRRRILGPLVVLVLASSLCVGAIAVAFTSLARAVRTLQAAVSSPPPLLLRLPLPVHVRPSRSPERGGTPGPDDTHVVVTAVGHDRRLRAHLHADDPGGTLEIQLEATQDDPERAIDPGHPTYRITIHARGTPRE